MNAWKWCAVIASLCIRCVPMPTQPSGDIQVVHPHGLFVLCEGLWRQNNTVVSYVNLSTGATLRDVLAHTSPGVRLGDTGSDMVAVGDTIVVVMNTSRSVELLQRSTGRWLGSIPMPLGKEPYRACVITDSTVMVTNLNDDTMTEMNIRRGTIRIVSVPTGPAPEGIDTDGSVLAVANSGLGDLRHSETDAGTVYIYQVSDLQRVRVLRGLPNVGGVRFDRQRRVLWVSYRHRTSMKDSLGGVVAYDGRSWNVLGHWRLPAPGRMQVGRDGRVFVLAANGLHQITVGHERPAVLLPWHGRGVWYGMMVDEAEGRMYITNAGQFVTDGVVEVYTMQGEAQGRWSVGLNPSVMVR